jgi:hypothetical protein
MLAEGMSTFGLVADFSILLATVAIMVIIGGKLYPGGNVIFFKILLKVPTRRPLSRKNQKFS